MKLRWVDLTKLNHSLFGRWSSKSKGVFGIAIGALSPPRHCSVTVSHCRKGAFLLSEKKNELEDEEPEKPRFAASLALCYSVTTVLCSGGAGVTRSYAKQPLNLQGRSACFRVIM